jgi:hypothetical protein
VKHIPIFSLRSKPAQAAAKSLRKC